MKKIDYWIGVKEAVADRLESLVDDESEPWITNREEFSSGREFWSFLSYNKGPFKIQKFNETVELNVSGRYVFSDKDQHIGSRIKAAYELITMEGLGAQSETQLRERGEAILSAIGVTP